MRAEVEEQDGKTFVTLCVGEYRLRWILPDHGKFSEVQLVNSEDEAMTLSEEEFEQVLDEHFMDNF